MTKPFSNIVPQFSNFLHFLKGNFLRSILHILTNTRLLYIKAYTDT